MIMSATEWRGPSEDSYRLDRPAGWPYRCMMPRHG